MEKYYIKKILLIVLLFGATVTGGCAFQSRNGADGEIREADTEDLPQEHQPESAWRICEYEDELHEEWDMPYVDEDGFAVIRELYGKVEFLGDFPSGDREHYEEYRERFRQMLDNQMPIQNRETGEEIYFKDMKNIRNHPIISEEYYFFDMDEDGFPELGIRDEDSNDVYYLKYDEETGKGLLWYELAGTWRYTFGSRKVGYLWGGGQYITFLQLNAEGEAECVVNSFERWKNSDVSLHVAALPVYPLDGTKAETEDWLKAQGAFVEYADQWYFRVKEKQYNELMAYLWAAEALAEREMEKVTYTSEELFVVQGQTIHIPEKWESMASARDDSASAERTYVSDEVFETIRAAYQEIDFFAEFESGNLDVYDEYTAKFLELLDGKIPAVDRETGKEQYLRDYELFQGSFAPEQYEYSLFDANGDGLPELGLRYACHRFDEKVSYRDYQEYIFQYDSEAEKVFLWHQGYGTAWTGTGKLQRRRLGEKPWYVHWGMQYQGEEYACNEFLQVDEDGETICRLLGITRQDGGDGLYMVTLPQYGGSGMLEEIPEEHFFRVTAKQYHQLFACYEQAYWFAASHEEEVVYTYEELHDWRAKYDPDPAVG